MSVRIIENYEQLESLTGQELGVSEYFTISQEQINRFADVTLDRQWIHVDEERAKAESPFKSTIVHGYLTVSMLPYLWAQIMEVHNLKMQVNYGIEKLKFNQPVLSGGAVRLRARLLSVNNLRGIIKANIGVTMEIKDNPKPAFEGTVIFVYHFNK